MDQERVALTPEETAKRLGLGRTSTYKAIKSGQIPSVKFGKRIFVPITALERLMIRSFKSTQSPSAEVQARTRTARPKPAA